jgi:hypothetical protein
MNLSKVISVVVIQVLMFASGVLAQDHQQQSPPQMAPGFTSDHPGLAQWYQHLAGKRLTQMESYYSSGGSVDGYSTGGGYSSQSIIHLCRDKTFTAIQQGGVSVDAGGGFGSGGSNSQYEGTWTLITNGQVVGLILMSSVGGRAEFAMEFNQGQTFANGVRTFLTDDSVCTD